VLVLETGVQSVFGDRDVVDEGKFDGFDVRIVDVDGPLAFTRSGYV
jgi:ATP-dependent RNA circularization protein (DNA/RNA ligase family)